MAEYSAQDKILAAKELENARQAVRERGYTTQTDVNRVAQAEAKYIKVMGKKPPKAKK